MEEKKLQRRKEKAFEERNDEQLAQACRSLGDYYNQHGRYEEACKEYQKSSSIFSKIGKQLEMAKANRMVAEMFMLLSEFEKALKHVNTYLKIVKKLGNLVETQRAYATLGRAYLLQGQSAASLSVATKTLKLAEKAFIQSLLVCKELSGQVSKVELLDMQARLYLNIGVVREHMEDFEESISYMEKATKICKTNDLYELLHLCYISASLLYHYKKYDCASALRFCNLALEISERLPNRTKKECETLIIKAEIMIQEGDFQSAKQILRKGYKLKSPEINDRENIERMLRVVAALCNTLDALVTTNLDDHAKRKTLYERMGDGCCLLQNFKKAIDYYLKMLECVEACHESPKDLAAVYVSLSQTYKDNKEYDKALEYLWKEYEINRDEPLEAFNTLCNIGEIYELESKPFWTTQDCYQKAIEEARKLNNSRLERIACVRLMKLQKKFNMFTLMENLKDELNKRGIELVENEDESDEESAPGTEHNTPNIGDEICLDDLTDTDDERTPTTNAKATRPQRKRNVGITVKRNNKGETQLHQACIAGNIELARRLIEQGHTVNVRDHAGWLPLHEACNHGFREIVELLLDNGASAAINDKGGTGCDGITPLYDACSNGFIEIAELLLERGANATLKTDFGDNALNVLEKWRNSVNLDVFEQSQYEKVRSIIAEQLNKAGMMNDNITLKLSYRDEISYDHENSLDRLRQIAGDSGSESSSSEPSCSRRRSKGNRLSDEERDYTSFSSVQSSKKLMSPLKDSSINPSNAKQEYKSIMESMKHPNRAIVTAAGVSLKKRSGFLEPDDVEDDWLIDDMRPDKKKRKLLSDRNIYNTETNSRLSLPSSYKENFNHREAIHEDDEDSQDAFQLLLESKGVPKKANKNKLPRSSSLTGSNKSRKQSSLLESGFCRFRSESPQSVDENIGPEPDSTTNTVVIVQQSPQKDISTIASTVSFKIKVEDEMLLIPIDKKKLSEANIRWLAEETSRRYYNLVGLRPILRLMTIDGFAFEENDLISVALEHNMITAKVLEWKISPLSQRYEEMCDHLQIEVDFNIKSALEKSQSNCLHLNDEALTPDITLPVFKALLHQTTLRILDVSNNFIQDEGCKQLGKSLGTLKQLKTLNLKGNCITPDGLHSLAVEGLNELEELFLSYNPLGNASVRILEKICSQCPKLKKLNLSSCRISSFFEYDLRFFDLVDFDISFNNLSPSALKSVLMKMNSCRVQCLNLNFSSPCDTQFGSKLLEFLQSGTCEKFQSIQLAGCNLTDMDVFNIAVHLSKAKDFRKINLSLNSKLTPASLQHILDNVPWAKKIYMEHCWLKSALNRWPEINLGTVEKCPELIVLSANEVDEVKLHEIWDLKHGTHANVLTEGNLLKMYVNECDIR